YHVSPPRHTPRHRAHSPFPYTTLFRSVANVPPQGGRKHPHQEFTPVDTTNILFICGGAFVGLEKIIEKRAGRRSLGNFLEAHERDRKGTRLDSSHELVSCGVLWL